MSASKPQWPKTADEWQVAVDSAHGALCLDSARQYGLVTGGPVVNVDRCERILTEGKRKGHVPSPDAITRFALELALAEVAKCTG